MLQPIVAAIALAFHVIGGLTGLTAPSRSVPTVIEQREAPAPTPVEERAPDLPDAKGPQS